MPDKNTPPRDDNYRAQLERDTINNVVAQIMVVIAVLSFMFWLAVVVSIVQQEHDYTPVIRESSE